MNSSKKAKTVAIIFMVILGVIWITPILWLIFSSFKKDSDFITSFANLKGSLDYLKRLIPRNVCRRRGNEYNGKYSCNV